MASLPGLVGPVGRVRVINLNAEDTINLYVEREDAGTPKNPTANYSRPVLQVFRGLAGAPVRGLFSQDDRCFAVAGNNFSEIFSNGSGVLYGTVASDQFPATFVSNGTAGHQIFLTSGGQGYVFDLNTNVLSAAITASGFPAGFAGMADYIDSYFLVLKRDSIQFNYSALLDGTSWGGLQVINVSQSSDNVQALRVNHREIWLLGSKHTAVWEDVADGNNPFEPNTAVFIEQGIIAPYSVAQFDNTIVWMSGDERGARMIVKAQGYTPIRISTHAIEDYINRLPRVDDAIAWTYQEAGHAFYVLYLPAAFHTLVYDASSQQWTKWSHWNPTQCRDYPYAGRCHTYVWNRHLVGDRQSGTVYEQVLEPGAGNYADDLVIQGGL